MILAKPDERGANQPEDLASRTAAKKNKTTLGTLTAKIIVVAIAPSSGCPDESSKIEPTEAIAATQEAPKKREVLGDMNMRNAYQ